MSNQHYTTQTLQERFESHVIPEPMSGCWLWTASTRRGYGRLEIKARDYPAHRISWELYVGPIPEGMDVLHKCDVRPCVNPYHLFIGTNSDNMLDCSRKGRMNNNPRCGEAHPKAKLTVQNIIAIRGDQRKTATIAREYGVSFSSIAAARHRISWKHIP